LLPETTWPKTADSAEGGNQFLHNGKQYSTPEGAGESRVCFFLSLRARFPGHHGAGRRGSLSHTKAFDQHHNCFFTQLSVSKRIVYVFQKLG
jgi:hypothetical protein